MLGLSRLNLRQFSLRTLLLAVTGCSVALAVWRMPFQADVKDPDEYRLRCAVGMTADEIRAFDRERDARRETGYVYRDFHGNLVKHGVAILYSGNGMKIRERHWSHGKLDGLETTWDDTGQIEQETRYRDGNRHGWSRFFPSQVSYYEDGVLIRAEHSSPNGKYVVENRADGTFTCTNWSYNAEKIDECTHDCKYRRQGPTMTWHANGTIGCQGNWRDNREHGTWSWRDDQGSLLRRVEFDNGVRQPSSPTARRHKFILEADEQSANIDAKLCRILSVLFEKSSLHVGDDSLSEALAWLEELHSDVVFADAAPFRIQVRGSDVRARLDAATITKLPDNIILRDAFHSLLTPLRLEAVIHDNSIWIVDVDDARGWTEATPISRFVSGRVDASWLSYIGGLTLGRTTLRGMFDELKTHRFVMRLDYGVKDAHALLAREIDAGIPGCTGAAALDIVLGELGLTYFAENDEFVVTPIETP